MKSAGLLPVWGLVLWAAAVEAQPIPAGPAEQEEPLARLTEEAVARGLLDRDFLTGDWGGARTTLAQRFGILPHATYTAEVLGNPVGGMDQGAVYNGLLNVGIVFNLETMTDGAWEGATFFANAYLIQGRSLTENYVGDLFVLNSINAPNTIRLSELWFQQEFLDERVSLRIGQLLADTEFGLSHFSALFLNGTFDGPGSIATNAPMPTYPAGGLGVRLRVEPTEETYVMGGIYQGEPYPFDAQGKPVNNHGVYWNLEPEQGVFGIFEAGYKLNQKPSAAGWRFQSDEPKSLAAAHTAGPGAITHTHNLPGEYRIGGWFHTGSFDSRDTDNNGFPLESPLASGVPATVDGNWGLYLTADQMLWREDPDASWDSMDTCQGLGAFFNFYYADPDASFFNVSAEFGLAYTGLIPGRDQDSLGIGFAYGGITDAIGRVSSATGGPVYDFTAALEITYQAVITPWWIVQPDLQYIFRPDGAATASGGVPDAVVVGLRTEIAF